MVIVIVLPAMLRTADGIDEAGVDETG